MKQTRRDSLKTIIGFGACAPLAGVLPTRAASANSRLRIAAVGAGGKGYDDLIGASGAGKHHDIVALCDIDHRNGGEQPPNLAKAQALRPLGLGKARAQFPQAKVYSDFRKMLEQGDIDAVTVSTPDHMHATVALTAMALGKHVYVQKPLTQTIHESRVMRRVANEQGVITQMGNQGHSSTTYRTAVEALRSGILGKIREVHASTSSPSWPQGIARPSGSDPVPEGVYWDRWLGVAEARPYVKHTYHNFNWRGWQAFGTGALGDMGCHIIDPAVWALELGPPSQVSAEVKGPSPDSYPTSSHVTYRFPGTTHTTDELILHWYDGGQWPEGELGKRMAAVRNGTIYVGEHGTMELRHGSSIARLYPQEKFQDYSRTTLKKLYADFAAERMDHYQMWTDAILAGKQANSPFDYAAPLNETVMIGTVAQRLPGRTLTWNAPALSFDDSDATALVYRSYRKGWEVPALRR